MKQLIAIILLFMGSVVNAQTDPAGLKVGDAAPMFSGNDQNGQQFSLQSALKKGDVVVMFYRGQWCPYCNKQMSQMNDSLKMITDKGATVIAISPEVQESVQKTTRNTGSL